MKEIAGILTMALVTYLQRVLPLTIFRKKLNSRFLRSFLYFMPYTVLTALTVPAIFTCTGNPATAAVGTVTAIVLSFFKQSLITVAIAAVAAVYLSSLLLG